MDKPIEEDWTLSPIEKGILTVNLKTWESFHEYVATAFLSEAPPIFRGHQSEHWRLKSSFDRFIDDHPKLKEFPRDYHLRTHLENFKYLCKGRRGINPPDPDGPIWWALGQHWRLVTPLIDWTESPYIALFFAFENEDLKDQSENRVVYALMPWAINVSNRLEARMRDREKKVDSNPTPGGLVARMSQNAPIPEKTETTEFVVLRPISDENQRLINQRALSVLTFSDHSIEEWVGQKYINSKSAVLVKILIPNSQRSKCLCALNSMNINNATLFPDLSGAASQANMALGIQNYMDVTLLHKLEEFVDREFGV